MINVIGIDKVRENMRNLERKIDGLLVTNESNLLYLFGQPVYDYAYITQNEIYILTNSLYFEDLKVLENDSIHVYNMSSKGYVDNFRNILCGKIVGVETNYITIKQVDSFKSKFNIGDICITENVIENVRAIKQDYEIENIRKACEITVKAYFHMIEYIKPYLTEKQIKIELEHYMKKLGADDVAFDTIVASGANSSKPHAIAGNKKIQKKDIVLLDFGCKYNGYCSDMSRTIFVGDVSEKQKQIYELVLSAKENTMNEIKELANVQDIDDAIRNKFREQNLEEKYIHAAGHGVGIDVHESPTISNRAEYILKENMVLAIEPGIYLEKEFGVRIEDTILVTKDGIENLTQTNLDILVL